VLTRGLIALLDSHSADALEAAVGAALTEDDAQAATSRRATWPRFRPH
jgi:hypothetical protein